jgi:exonuclease VII small subunit
MEKVTQEKEALEASTAELRKQVTLLAQENEALEASIAVYPQQNRPILIYSLPIFFFNCIL